ncbi:uncharacterized protein H6S33_009711 [Morchella sextelata]|uniref:uncharacterized protein n=1 Tax=Morchella sextelata TaxID=1174677 RepID=UPI001D03FFD6|nr:uncharacterized protein H6S33_009711 [Morchella sextelata]KAH0613331.1 hypothetical protein H6S33_009711 [Morchella sextelata]
MPTATTQTTYLLRHPTPTELTHIRTQHSTCWAGALTVSQYLTREDHIASTPLTRNGGMTQWVLVDAAADPAHVLASCEAIRKKALVAHTPVDGEKRVPVEEVVAYGIGSVFTPPECRGNGYAKVMLTMLGERLKRHNGQRAGFSVLYSDIGKQFYAKLGWLPHKSSHIELPVRTPAPPRIHPSRVQPLYHADIAPLCALDTAALRTALSTRHPKTRIAFVPDHGTMDWHHNREEFIGACVRPDLGAPAIKGCITASGTRWMVWGRDFSVAGPRLYVLRVVDFGPEEGRREDLMALLSAAVEEAGRWGLGKVVVWNPAESVVGAAGAVVDGVVGVERESDSIASLMMYGKGGSGEAEVEWVLNEKYAWC